MISARWVDICKLKKLIDPLPRPFILLGDFNSHNNLWGCKDTNKKGKMLERVINENDMCLLNYGAVIVAKGSVTKFVKKKSWPKLVSPQHTICLIFFFFY